MPDARREHLVGALVGGLQVARRELALAGRRLDHARERSARERVDGDRHLLPGVDVADLRLGHVDADVQLAGSSSARGRRVGREDVARAQVQRLDARGARRADRRARRASRRSAAAARGRRRPAPAPTSRPAASRAAARPAAPAAPPPARRRCAAASVALSASTRVAGAAARTACGSAPRPAWPSPRRPLRLQRAPAPRRSRRGARSGSVRLATFSSAPSACVSCPCGDQALGGQVALLQRDERLPGRDRVALADVHLLDAAADARADLDRPRLHGAAPLERRARPAARGRRRSRRARGRRPPAAGSGVSSP